MVRVGLLLSLSSLSFLLLLIEVDHPIDENGRF